MKRPFSFVSLLLAAVMLLLSSCAEAPDIPSASDAADSRLPQVQSEQPNEGGGAEGAPTERKPGPHQSLLGY
jgi:hypothetical protein